MIGITFGYQIAKVKPSNLKFNIMESNKVNIKFSVYQSEKTVRVSFDDLGVTEDEYMALSVDEKREIVRCYLDEMPDQPFWEIDDFFTTRQ